MKGLVKAHAIEAFHFEAGSKHPKINFKHSGRWDRVTFSMSPRTSNETENVMRRVKHIIRGGVEVRVQ